MDKPTVLMGETLNEEINRSVQTGEKFDKYYHVKEAGVIVRLLVYPDK